jgi:hypothetical protein
LLALRRVHPENGTQRCVLFSGLEIIPALFLTSRDSSPPVPLSAPEGCLFYRGKRLKSL